MSDDVQYESSLTVIGIATRTTNSSAHEIGALWKRFYETGGDGRIAACVDDSIYSIYSEYESGHTGSFTVLIGCAVPETTPVPQGMSKQTIAAGRYAVFAVTGKLPESIAKTWSSIWDTPIWDTPLDRVYDTDFERYEKDGAITVHVGVR